MVNYDLYRVTGVVLGFAEPLQELVQAASPAEAARRVRQFWVDKLETLVPPRELLVQTFCAPDELGIVYERGLPLERFTFEGNSTEPRPLLSLSQLDRLLLATCA